MSLVELLIMSRSNSNNSRSSELVAVDFGNSWPEWFSFFHEPLLSPPNNNNNNNNKLLLADGNLVRDKVQFL